MDLDENDIYEVMLVNLRMATWLNLPHERKFLADSLLRSGISQEIVKVWQQPHCIALKQELAELHENLANYEPLLQAFPDIFVNGTIGTCFAEILRKASEFVGPHSPRNLNAPPLRRVK